MGLSGPIERSKVSFDVSGCVQETPHVNHDQLKTRQRAERDGHPPNMAIRVHRSLSWLKRAEQLGDDPDGQFVYLWIAFNAAYAQHIDDRYRVSERDAFREFMQRLLGADTKGIVLKIVYNEFQKSIKKLIENRFIFQGFWDSHNGAQPRNQWPSHFSVANKAAVVALKKRDTATILSVVLSRIYTLRNQLMHGGSTWNSSVNRDQVRDCCAFMGKLIPAIIFIMLDHKDVDWGDVMYPVVTEDNASKPPATPGKPVNAETAA
jgi:hypothetical protein